MTISSVQYLHDLKKVGFNDEQAEMQVTQQEALIDEFKKLETTVVDGFKKVDMRFNQVHLDFKDLELRLIKWLIGTGFVMTSVSIGVFFTIY